MSRISLFFLILLGLTTLSTAAEKKPFADSPFGSLAADVANNNLLIVDDGYDALLLRVHLIRNARRSIGVQTFIWKNDECGRRIMWELVEAAKRGVKVQVIIDHFGSAKDADLAAFLCTVHPNLQMKHYRPAADRLKANFFQKLFNTVLFFNDTNQRMHNKIMIFDDSIAITGGRNIDNHYYNASANRNFKDRDIVAIGPTAGPIRDSFRKFWDYKHSVPSEKLKDVAKSIKRGEFARFESRAEYAFDGIFDNLDDEAEDASLIQSRFVDRFLPARKAEFLCDEPGKNGKWWLFRLWGEGEHTKKLKEAVKKAKEEILIQTPYLVLSSPAKRIFKDLRKKNPDLNVVISTNSLASTDNLYAYSANYKMRSYYIETLGFKIYEYKPHPDDYLLVAPNFADLEERAAARIEQGEQTRMPYLCMHAKSLIIDDRVAYVGSYNMDPRSANLNSEVGLLIEGEEIVEGLKSEILRDIGAGNSWVVAKRQRPLGLLGDINYVFEGISEFSPLDLWPFENTSCFELIPGKEPVGCDDEDFYDNYEEVGSFPGDENMSKKEIMINIYKSVGKIAIPVM